ncbi:hypothetical protein [Breoghania sp.]|uniref:hypothetical protein n=1 Tax=Breoghania sp. TaxID=2065378 RepID=UPI0029CA8BB0|nr:hypothetical protein [Breoghania sp.]
MQITGAGPTQQSQFDFDTKIERQGSQSSQELQSGPSAGNVQAASGNDSTPTSPPVQAASDSSESGTQDRPPARERGVGSSLDISV